VIAAEPPDYKVSNNKQDDLKVCGCCQIAPQRNKRRCSVADIVADLGGAMSRARLSVL
jgi:hypothetical protein